MNGTEDAAAVWRATWTNHVGEEGIQIGSASSVLFAGPELQGLCHGDDCWLVAARRELEIEAHLSTKFEIRRTGHIGDGNEKSEKNRAAQVRSWRD